MDLKTYHQREVNLEAAEKLIAAERARLDGVSGYSMNEFESCMRAAIRQGAQKGAVNEAGEK